MDAETKLAMIRDMCRHPVVCRWSGQDVADAITRLINEEPIHYELSELDHPVPYELVADAVYGGDE